MVYSTSPRDALLARVPTSLPLPISGPLHWPRTTAAGNESHGTSAGPSPATVVRKTQRSDRTPPVAGALRRSSCSLRVSGNPPLATAGARTCGRSTADVRTCRDRNRNSSAPEILIFGSLSAQSVLVAVRVTTLAVSDRRA